MDVGSLRLFLSCNFLPCAVKNGLSRCRELGVFDWFDKINKFSMTSGEQNIVLSVTVRNRMKIQRTPKSLKFISHYSCSYKKRTLRSDS